MPIYEFNCEKHGKFEELFQTYVKDAKQPCPECKSLCSRIMSKCRHSIKGWSPDKERKGERAFQQDMRTANEPIRVSQRELRDMAREEERKKGKRPGSIVPLTPEEKCKMNFNKEDKTGNTEHCKMKDGREFRRMTKKGLDNYGKNLDFRKSADYQHMHGGHKKMKPLKRLGS